MQRASSQTVLCESRGVVLQCMLTPRSIPMTPTMMISCLAASSGSAEIELLNVSPHVRATDGHSIFVDAISIVPTVDCGEGATCHTAIDGSGYTCKCNGRG